MNFAIGFLFFCSPLWPCQATNIWIYRYVYVNEYMNLYVNVNIEYIDIYIYMYTYIYICIHIYIYMYISILLCKYEKKEKKSVDCPLNKWHQISYNYDLKWRLAFKFSNES